VPILIVRGDLNTPCLEVVAKWPGSLYHQCLPICNCKCAVLQQHEDVDGGCGVRFNTSNIEMLASVNGETEEDVASRIKKANGVFVQLYPVWRNRNISKGVKIRIFNTNVKSVYYMLVKLGKLPTR
jgi:hypothetical protein